MVALKRLTLFLFTAAILIAGFYTWVALKPLPELNLVVTAPEQALVTASDVDAQAAVDAQSKPTAIGWAEVDGEWSNDDRAFPLASISKLITVLVCLEASPLSPDVSTWGTHTWSYEDALGTEAYKASLGVAYPLAVGTEIALADMFKLIFLPSANDYAAAYAYSVFGDNETFVAAVDDWAARHGLDSVQLVEPTGMDERNHANPADLIEVGRLALNDPVVSQFVKIVDAEIPYIGYIENTNPLLRDFERVVGIKTGRSSSAGFNYLVAAKQEIDGREVTRISITMARDSVEERAQSGLDMLGLIADLPTETAIITSFEPIGFITTWQGQTITVETRGDLSATLLPGETVSRQLVLDTLKLGAASAGMTLGSVEAETPLGLQSVEVVLTEAITEPDLQWRFKHPFQVLFSNFD